MFDVAVLGEELGALIVETVSKRVAPLVARIEALEKAPFVYDGPYETGKTYQRGTFVSAGGSLWHCNTQTTARPGDGGAWTLAVKHGRDSAR